MSLYFSGQTRTIIFILVLLGGGASLFFYWQAGLVQSAVFGKDYLKYQEAERMLAQQRFTEAAKLLDDLAERDPDSYPVLWSFGVSLAAGGKPEAGLEFLRLARETRPALVQEPVFLLHYGETSFRLGDFKAAERYFLELKKYPITAELEKIAGEFLREISLFKEGSQLHAK